MCQTTVNCRQPRWRSARKRLEKTLLQKGVLTMLYECHKQWRFAVQFRRIKEPVPSMIINLIGLLNLDMQANQDAISFPACNLQTDMVPMNLFLYHACKWDAATTQVQAASLKNSTKGSEKRSCRKEVVKDANSLWVHSFVIFPHEDYASKDFAVGGLVSTMLYN